MKTAAIIAEYNPFHNGHRYQIEKTRQETGADFFLALMSGDFVQRGAPAFADKYTRTRMALLGGADVVIELPALYALSSAEYFAQGAVSLLERLNTVDVLSFGSESGNLTLFERCARILVENQGEINRRTGPGLKGGLSFPAARAKAVAELLSMGGAHVRGEDVACKESPDTRSTPRSKSEDGSDDILSILSCPNNILGLEYCTALRNFGSSIRPLAINRRESDYHQTSLGKQYSSATAVRHAICRGEPAASWMSQLPQPAGKILEQTLAERGWIEENDFSLLLKYKCMETPPEKLSRFFDVSGEMASRIHRCLNQFTDYQDFTAQIKTREITFTRAARGLLHILLNLRQPVFPESAVEYVPYGRILGFRKESAPLLSHIKKASRIPLVSQPAKFLKSNGASHSRACSMLRQDIHAANLYESVLAYKGHTPFTHECCRSIERV